MKLQIIKKRNFNKVILIPSTSAPVGVATSVLNLAILLREANFLESVICPSKGWLTTQLQSAEVPFHVIPFFYSIKKAVKSNFIIYRYLKNKEGNIIHINGRLPLFVCIISMILLKKHKYIVTMHSATGSHGLLHWKQLVESFCLRRFIDGISCVSSDLRDDIIERLGKKYEKNIYHIPNMIQPYNLRNEILPSPNWRQAKLQSVRIIAIGRLSPEKGFDILIKALDSVESNLNVECSIFGDGPEKEALDLLIKKFGLGKRITLLGNSNIIRKELPNYDIVVIPSRMESFGLISLEAYDAGVPVIASNVPGLSEIVTDNKTGLLFEANNSDDLAAAILRLSQSRELAARLAHGGRKRLYKYLPSKWFLNKFLQLYGLAPKKGYPGI